MSIYLSIYISLSLYITIYIYIYIYVCVYLPPPGGDGPGARPPLDAIPAKPQHIIVYSVWCSTV